MSKQFKIRRKSNDTFWNPDKGVFVSGQKVNQIRPYSTWGGAKRCINKLVINEYDPFNLEVITYEVTQVAIQQGYNVCKPEFIDAADLATHKLAELEKTC